MPLRAPHEYKVRKGSKSIEMVRENPTVFFVKQRQIRVGTAMDGGGIFEDNPEFHDVILYQDGHFYHEDGVEILKKDVPPYILAQLRECPPGKSQMLGMREIKMTVEEAEREFGDRGLDSRIAARQAQEPPNGDEDARPVRRQKPHPKRAAASAR